MLINNEWNYSHLHSEINRQKSRLKWQASKTLHKNFLKYGRNFGFIPAYDNLSPMQNFGNWNPISRILNLVWYNSTV